MLKLKPAVCTKVCVTLNCHQKWHYHAEMWNQTVEWIDNWIEDLILICLRCLIFLDDDHDATATKSVNLPHTTLVMTFASSAPYSYPPICKFKCGVRLMNNNHIIPLFLSKSLYVSTFGVGGESCAHRMVVDTSRCHGRCASPLAVSGWSIVMEIYPEIMMLWHTNAIYN